MMLKKKTFAESSPMVAVGGAIKAAETIALGDPKTIEKVEHVLKTCAVGGKYDHMPDCCLPSTTSLENLDAFIISARKIGRVG